MCHLNVNSQLYRGLGPFNFQTTTCATVCKKINATMESLGRFEKTLREFLTPESFCKHQQDDKEIKKYLDHLQNNTDPRSVMFSENGILKRKLKSGLTDPSCCAKMHTLFGIIF